MNKFITLLKSIITKSVLILSVSLLMSPAYADELKDISQMADQGQTGAAIDRLNTYITANPKKSSAVPGKRSCVQLHLESTQEVAQSSVGLW